MYVGPVRSVAEIEAAWSFVLEVFPHVARPDMPRTVAYYVERFPTEADLQILAEDGGEIVGTTLGSMEGDHTLVREVAVRDGHRGAGLGTRLMHALEDAARTRGSTGLVLGAVDDAVGFYIGCGFTPIVFVQITGAGAMAIADRAVAEPPLRDLSIAQRWDQPEWVRLFIPVERPDLDLVHRVAAAVPQSHVGFVMTKDMRATPREESGTLGEKPRPE